MRPGQLVSGKTARILPAIPAKKGVAGRSRIMASIFKRHDRRPIPEGAEITTRRKQKVVRFKDDRARTQVHPLSEDGSRMLVERRAWYVAYQDASGERQIVK